MTRPIQRAGHIAQKEMDRVFNNGLGMIVIAEPSAAGGVVEELRRRKLRAQIVGEVVRGKQTVRII